MDAASGRRLVAVRLPAGGALAEAIEAVWAAGDAVTPLDAALPGPEVAALLDELRPATLVDGTGSRALPGAEPVSDGVAAVVPTSGSTGRPRGVELTRSALEASARAGLARLDADGGDRWLCCLPLTHVGGLAILVRSRLLGRAPVIHARFDPAAVAAERDATLVSLVPTMLARLLDAGVDLSRFRRVLLGGAPADRGLLARARAAGAHVVVGYGLTETAGGCVYDGRPLDGVEVAVGPDGRIAVRGPVLMRGYRRRPRATAEALREGWLRTADLGRWDGQGRLEVLGRVDDVVVTGGRKVATGEVAALLRAHPGVADAAVLGLPDPEWGERVVAVVVPADPARPPGLDALRRFVAERAAAYKAPRRLVVVDALPRRPNGKLDRAALRRRVRSGAPAG